MHETGNIARRGDKLAGEFALFDDWIGRYEYLIELGKSLPPLDDAFKTEPYRIRGCQSQVWLKADLEGRRLKLRGDSDAMITRGLVAMLIRVLTDQPVEDIAEADLSFLDRIGMKEHLSSTRRNGLDAMIQRIRSIANEAAQDSDSASSAETNGVDVATKPAETNEPRLPGEAEIEDGVDLKQIEAEVIEALQQVFDPEIPVNVYDLGLIYEARVNPDRSVNLVMTLTTPNCPAAEILPGQVEAAVGNLPSVQGVRLQLTFDPPYTPDMMTDAARLELGWL